MLRLTVRYLNSTINRTTRNAKPEIEPHWSNQTQQDPWVSGSGAGFGLPRSTGSGFWTVLELIGTLFTVQTRTAGGFPGPVVNTSHALLEWQRNNGVHPKVSQPKLKADRSDGLNYFNYKNDGGQNACCTAAMGRKLMTSPGIAETYTLLTNTWDTLPECYQQRVYGIMSATDKRQIQHAGSLTPAVVISGEAGVKGSPFTVIMVLAIVY